MNIRKRYSIKKAVLLLLLLLLLPVAAGAMELSLPDATGIPGSMVDINLDVRDATDVGCLDVLVTYDPSVLTINSVEKGSLGEGILSANTNNPGIVSIVLIYGGGFSGTGQAAVIKCSVVGSAGATSPLSIGSVSAHSAVTYDDIPTTTSDGRFTVEVGQVTNAPGFSILLTLVVLALLGWVLRNRGKD